MAALRIPALLALVKRHNIGLDEQYSGAEDINYMLEGDDPDYPIDRYAVVTEQGSEFTYIYTYQTFPLALAGALGNIADDIWAETPIEIVDLDGGFEDDGVEYGRPKFKYSWRPDWNATPWKKVVEYA